MTLRKPFYRLKREPEFDLAIYTGSFLPLEMFAQHDGPHTTPYLRDLGGYTCKTSAVRLAAELVRPLNGRLMQVVSAGEEETLVSIFMPSVSDMQAVGEAAEAVGVDCVHVYDEDKHYMITVELMRGSRIGLEYLPNEELVKAEVDA